MSEEILVWVHAGILMLGAVKLLDMLTAAVLYLCRRAVAAGSARVTPAPGALAVDMPGKDMHGCLSGCKALEEVPVDLFTPNRKMERKVSNNN